MSINLLKATACSAVIISMMAYSIESGADSQTNINQLPENPEHHHRVHQGHSHGNTPDSHAPIGVMGDHFHNEGEIMLSYRYETMLMKGMLDGDSDVAPSSVVAAGGNYGYMMTPTRMRMDMHMLGAMYGVSDDTTLMLMTHYMENRMDMVNRMNVTSKMESQGFGDSSISAMIKIFDEKEYAGVDGEDEDEQERLHINLGLSLPTGSTDEKGMRMGAYGNLPYAMQLGSGTFDPIIGITYFEQEGEYSWGAQANAKFRLGKNDEGYRLGDRYSATSWVAKNLTDWASVSARLEAEHQGDISGADNNTIGLINMAPTFDPGNIGGETINIGVGFNLYQPDEGPLQGHRLAVEYLTPLYQNLNGVQMELQHQITFGWQYSW
jgi:hypothetical protein